MELHAQLHALLLHEVQCCCESAWPSAVKKPGIKKCTHRLFPLQNVQKVECCETSHHRKLQKWCHVSMCGNIVLFDG